MSPHYRWESNSPVGTWNKSTQEMSLVSVPSIFYGSSIKKGSINLKFYADGILTAQLRDTSENGELVEYFPRYVSTITVTSGEVSEFGEKIFGLYPGAGNSSTGAKVYQFKTDGVSPTGTKVGRATVVQIQGFATPAQIANEIVNAINNPIAHPTFHEAKLQDDGVTIRITPLHAGPPLLINQWGAGLDGPLVFSESSLQSTSTGRIAGVALYNEGIMALTGSWALHQDYKITTEHVPTVPAPRHGADSDGDGATADDHDPISPTWTL